MQVKRRFVEQHHNALRQIFKSREGGDEREQPPEPGRARLEVRRKLVTLVVQPNIEIALDDPLNAGTVLLDLLDDVEADTDLLVRLPIVQHLPSDLVRRCLKLRDALLVVLGCQILICAAGKLQKGQRRNILFVLVVRTCAEQLAQSNATGEKAVLTEVEELR